jgi:hypothetical protein
LITTISFSWIAAISLSSELLALQVFFAADYSRFQPDIFFAVFYFDAFLIIFDDKELPIASVHITIRSIEYDIDTLTPSLLSI